MSSLIYGRSLINKSMLSPLIPPQFRLTEEKIIKDLEPLAEYFNKPLSAEILLKVLYNVRKNQYYLEPEKYQFGINEFYKIAVLSGWDFEGTKKEQLSLKKATPKQVAKIKLDQIVRYSEETDLYKNIEQVKLAKVLRRVYASQK